MIEFVPKYRVFEFDFRFHDVAMLVLGFAEVESSHHGGHNNPEGSFDEVHAWATSGHNILVNHKFLSR